MYKTGEIYIPDYNQILAALHPAPELNVDVPGDRLSVAGMTSFPSLRELAREPDLEVKTRSYEFRRFTLEVFYGRKVRAWECIDGD